MWTLYEGPVRTLLRALDAYEAAIDAFVASGLDLGLYEIAAQKLDEVRRAHADIFPRAAREMMSLLVANSSLLLVICRDGGTHLDDPELRKQRAEHKIAVARLREALAAD